MKEHTKVKAYLCKQKMQRRKCIEKKQISLELFGTGVNSIS